MRRFVGLVALLAVLALTVPGPAQQFGTFNAATPRPITFQRVDTGQAIAPHNLQNAFHTPSGQQAFNLGNMFRNFTMPSWPPRIASAPILPAATRRSAP